MFTDADPSKFNLRGPADLAFSDADFFEALDAFSFIDTNIDESPPSQAVEEPQQSALTEKGNEKGVNFSLIDDDWFKQLAEVKFQGKKEGLQTNLFQVKKNESFQREDIRTSSMGNGNPNPSSNDTFDDSEKRTHPIFNEEKLRELSYQSTDFLCNTSPSTTNSPSGNTLAFNFAGMSLQSPSRSHSLLSSLDKANTLPVQQETLQNYTYNEANLDANLAFAICDSAIVNPAVANFALVSLPEQPAAVKSSGTNISEYASTKNTITADYTNTVDCINNLESTIPAEDSSFTILSKDTFDELELCFKTNPEEFLVKYFNFMSLEQLRAKYCHYDDNSNEIQFAIQENDYFAMFVALQMSRNASKFEGRFNFHQDLGNGVTIAQKVNEEFNTYKPSKSKADGPKIIYDCVSRPRLANILNISAETIIEIEEIIEKVADCLRVMINGNRVPRNQQRTPSGKKPKMETWVKKPESIKFRVYSIVKCVLWPYFGFGGRIIELLVRRLAYHIAQNKSKTKKPLPAATGVHNARFRKNVIHTASSSKKIKNLAASSVTKPAYQSVAFAHQPTTFAHHPRTSCSTSIIVEGMSLGEWLKSPQSDEYLRKHQNGEL